MRFVFYTNIVSPHQLPLARELVARLGAAKYRYGYLFDIGKERASLGWGDACPDWCEKADTPVGRAWLENADSLLCGYRDVGLMERRAAKGLRMVYVSERWFKPGMGMGRLLHPGCFRMARRFVRLIKAGKVSYLPMGIWAARDMARLVGLFSGDIRCLFRLKRVDTFFKAVYAARTRCPITLTIVGQGPEQARLARLLRRLAKKYGVTSPVTFHAAVPVAEVRAFMRSHDVYVLPSNGYEGWGAVVSEALEEGMEVFGTYEAGSSATLLPKENLFHAGDWCVLADKLVQYAQTRVPHCRGIGKWNAQYAAECLVDWEESVQFYQPIPCGRQGTAGPAAGKKGDWRIPCGPQSISRIQTNK